jgi:hypothetical protein
MKSNSNAVKVVGRIVLSETSTNRKPKCADCGTYVDNSFGDSRVTVTTFDSKLRNSERKVCSYCADMLFENSLIVPLGR